ncbi:MAG: cation:proton antiporter [Methanoregula sp.]|jgi:CPA2 family monovalent cation:H+ antiporter-2
MDILLAAVCVIILSIILLYFGHRFGLPSIVSFLVIGMVAGPFGLALIRDQTLISTIGEIGIILLLFTIGLEFSFQSFLRSWRAVIIGGIVQICTTVLIITAINLAFQMPFNEALIFGFIVSLSSTAIVMKILQEKGEVDTFQGRTLLGILIFQDLAIIPMMLLVPLLAGNSTGFDLSVVPYEIAKIALIFLVIIVLGYWIIPMLLFRVAKERSHELFLFTIAGICIIIAWLTNEAGLSVTMGAFIAGLIIGESDYNIDALGHIIPFRDVFAAIFFLSIGMLLNTGTILDNFVYVALIILVIFCVKVFTGAFSAAILGMPARVYIYTGLALAQIGEFSFVLIETGRDAGVIQDQIYQIFLAGAIVTMACAPFAIRASPSVVDLLYRLFPTRIKREKPEDDGGPEVELTNHIIIAGYGITGKSVARAATLAGIPYMVIELNPEIIRQERSPYRPNFIFGDAVQEEVLLHAGIKRARTLVVVVSEEEAIPRIIHAARNLSPQVHILARTRHVRNAQHLLDLGADEVISEEFESALEIFTRALKRYEIPEEEVARIIKRAQRMGAAMFTKCTDPVQQQKIQNFETLFKATHIHTVQVESGSFAEGKTIGGLGLKDRFGIREFGFRRGTMRFTQPDPGMLLEAGDTLVFFITDQMAGEIIPLFSFKK